MNNPGNNHSSPGPSSSGKLSLSKALLVTELSKPNATPSSVAERLGCTTSAITQALQADPALQQQVMEARLVAAKSGLYLDEKYDKLEKTALEQLEKVLPYVSDPMKLARVAQTMNAAKRRAGPQVAGEGSESKVVRLLLPRIVEHSIQLGQNNEVVQIGERALVTMPAASVLQQAKEKQAAQVAAAKELPKLGEML